MSWKRDIRRKKKLFELKSKISKPLASQRDREQGITGMTPVTGNFERGMVILVTSQFAQLFSKCQLYPCHFTELIRLLASTDLQQNLEKPSWSSVCPLTCRCNSWEGAGCWGLPRWQMWLWFVPRYGEGLMEPWWPRLAGWPPPDSGQAETERFCAPAELGLPVTQAKPSSRFPTTPRRSLAAALRLFFQVSRGCIKYWFLSCF